jgi:hypothetical protein
MMVHMLLLQDLMGVQALSAGIWYVSIDFQLFAIALASVWLAGQLKRWQPQWKLRSLMLWLWFGLATMSLMWWNRQVNMDVEGLYFFGSYGLGMLAYRVRLSRISLKGWVIIFMLGLVAFWLEPRLRMALAWIIALLLARGFAFFKDGWAVFDFIVIAIAGGATVLSHFNDSGFWLVSRFLNMDEKTTLKTWTVMETLLGTIAFLIVATASAIL